MATTMSRLQIAERIHQLLLREIGFAIEIDRLLADARYARDVLLVCDATPGGELIPLASLFREASRRRPAGLAGAPGHAQQPTEWSRDTSGFGVTQPPPAAGTAAPAAKRAGDPAGEPGTERRRNWLQRWRDDK